MPNPNLYTEALAVDTLAQLLALDAASPFPRLVGDFRFVRETVSWWRWDSTATAGGLVPADGNGRWFEGTTGYVRVAPRVREWTNVAVSTSGQNYVLGSIPQSGNCLVHCVLIPGIDSFAAASPLLLAFAAPSDPSKPSPTAPTGYTYPGSVQALDAGSDYQSGFSYQSGVSHIWIPAENGRIWAIRSGSYYDVGTQTSLDVLGYQEV